MAGQWVCASLTNEEMPHQKIIYIFLGKSKRKSFKNNLEIVCFFSPG